MIHFMNRNPHLHCITKELVEKCEDGNNLKMTGADNNISCSSTIEISDKSRLKPDGDIIKKNSCSYLGILVLGK